MGVKRNTNASAPIKYNFGRIGGRSLIEQRPVFSPDGESLLVVVEDKIRVYNIQTGDCSRILESDSPVDEFVAVQFLENEDHNLYGCSRNGILTIWTWENGAVLREVNLELSSKAGVESFHIESLNECIIVSSDDKFVNLRSHCVKTGKCIREHIIRPPNYGLNKITFGWCNGDRYAAISNGTKMLYIQNLTQPHVTNVIINHNSLRITALSAHSTDPAIAIGDALGRVTIIKGDLYDYRNVAKEVLHWHFLPVFSLSYSLTGGYLYSGGIEKVLVKWSLGQLLTKAGAKSFIPRLPGMIRHITANSTHVAITLSNNSVVIADAQLHVKSTLLECGGAWGGAGGRLLHHRGAHALLLRAPAAALQLYSVRTHKLLCNIDVSQMNKLPAERHNLIPVETEVTSVALNCDGTWLVTSEYRNDGTNYPEERLKFWSSKTKVVPYKLNTCVNLSHGGCKVISLAMDSKGQLCVSGGTDQKFRIWQKEKSVTSQNIWTCLTACYYSSGISLFMSQKSLNNIKCTNFEPEKIGERPYITDPTTKNDMIKKLYNMHKEQDVGNTEEEIEESELSMGGVAISRDGSLIAAWFGCKLTLWDTHLCTLRTSLSHPALRPKGIDVEFGNSDASHYLACTTENCLAVWSLLSLTVKWLVQMNPTRLVSDPFSNRMAVVTTNNDLHVFEPHDSKPLLTRKRLLDPATGVFRHCTFGPTSKKIFSLYLLRNNNELYALEPEKSSEVRLEAITSRNLPASNFGALLAEQRVTDVRELVSADIQRLDTDSLGNSAISQFLSGAPHMVPPVSLLSTQFLQHISGHKETIEPEDQDEMDIPVQESSDDEDMNVTIGPYAPKPELWTPNYEQVKEKRLKKLVNEQLLNLHVTESMFGA